MSGIKMNFSFNDGVNNIKISKFGDHLIMVTRNNKDSIVEHLFDYLIIKKGEISTEEEGFILGCGLSMLLVNVVDSNKMEMIKNLIK